MAVERSRRRDRLVAYRHDWFWQCIGYSQRQALLQTSVGWGKHTWHFGSEITGNSAPDPRRYAKAGVVLNLPSPNRLRVWNYFRRSTDNEPSYCPFAREQLMMPNATCDTFDTIFCEIAVLVTVRREDGRWWLVKLLPASFKPRVVC